MTQFIPITAEQEAGEDGPPKRTIPVKTITDAINELEPPDYLITGIMQRRRLYTMTAATGSGKTTLMVRMALCISTGAKFFDHEVENGRVLYLVGENPDDTLPRFSVAAKAMKIDLGKTGIIVTTDKFSLADAGKLIADQVKKHGPVCLVCIDTGPAFFAQRKDTKDGENSNDDMIKFAHEMRDLIGALPGSPTILAAMHPGKNPTGKSDLIPRGGSALLNEVDGNFSIWTENRGKLSEFHWAGKHRGADFEPFSFKNTQTSEGGILDSKGNEMLSVYAEPISASDQIKMENETQSTRHRIILALHQNPAGYSNTALAGILERSGKKIGKSAVTNQTKRMITEKVIEKNGEFFRLTPKGIKEAKAINGTKKPTSFYEDTKPKKPADDIDQESPF